jgi:hypothetical protein
MIEFILLSHDEYCHFGSFGVHINSYTFQIHMLPPYSEKKLKATRTSELHLNNNQTARRHTPEEDIPDGHHCEKLKISRF